MEVLVFLGKNSLSNSPSVVSADNGHVMLSSFARFKTLMMVFLEHEQLAAMSLWLIPRL